MPGEIVQWCQERIHREGWLRVAFHPQSRAEGRILIIQFKRWFEAEGKGACMILTLDHAASPTIAFNLERDAVLFRLFHPEVPANRVLQPHGNDHNGD